MAEPLLAAVEAGGTKFIAAVAHDPLKPLATARFDTGPPAETLASVAAWLNMAQAEFGTIDALGMGAFGPIDVAPDSPNRGVLLPTPKGGWGGVDMIRGCSAGLDCPVAVDTDVNAAALAEARHGAGKGVKHLAYITVGTGIGGGLFLGGALHQGRLHPEIGHLMLRRHPDDDFPGLCPFHGDCAEGLVSGPALRARLGHALTDAGDPFAPILAFYLGQICATLVLVASVERIVIGGGVMKGLVLHGDIVEQMRASLAGYVVIDEDRFVCPPALGEASGLTGAFELARNLLRPPL